jgi:hypothetical protein
MPYRRYLRSQPDARPTYDEPALPRATLVAVTLGIVLLTGLSLVVRGLM